MEAFPHHYRVTVEASAVSHLTARAENLPALIVAPPAQFGGPGDQWSPEDLLVAAAANCFVLSFRAVAAMSKFEWVSIECHCEGKLDKVDRKLRFTDIMTQAKLVIPAAAHVETARKLLLKAEETCLVSNSLNSERHLECEIKVVGQ